MFQNSIISDEIEKTEQNKKQNVIKTEWFNWFSTKKQQHAVVVAFWGEITVTLVRFHGSQLSRKFNPAKWTNRLITN